MPKTRSDNNANQSCVQWVSGAAHRFARSKGTKVAVATIDELTRFSIGASFGYGVSSAMVSGTNVVGIDSDEIKGWGWYIPTVAFAFAYMMTGLIQHIAKANVPQHADRGMSALQLEGDLIERPSAATRAKKFEENVILKLGEGIEYTAFALSLLSSILSQQIRESFPPNPCGGPSHRHEDFLEDRNMVTIGLQCASVVLILTALAAATHRSNRIQRVHSRSLLADQNNIDFKKLKKELRQYAALTPFHNALRVTGVVSLLNKFMIVPAGYTLPTIFGVMDVLLLIKMAELASGAKFVKFDSRMSRALKFLSSYSFPISMMNYNYVQYKHRVDGIPLDKVCSISDGYFFTTLAVASVIATYRACTMKSADPYAAAGNRAARVLSINRHDASDERVRASRQLGGQRQEIEDFIDTFELVESVSNPVLPAVRQSPDDESDVSSLDTLPSDSSSLDSVRSDSSLAFCSSDAFEDASDADFSAVSGKYDRSLAESSQRSTSLSAASLLSSRSDSPVFSRRSDSALRVQTTDTIRATSDRNDRDADTISRKTLRSSAPM